MMISVTAYGRVSRNAQLMTTAPVSVIDELEATLFHFKQGTSWEENLDWCEE